jgi:hypothetical protein
VGLSLLQRKFLRETAQQVLSHFSALSSTFPFWILMLLKRTACLSGPRNQRIGIISPSSFVLSKKSSFVSITTNKTTTKDPFAEILLEVGQMPKRKTDEKENEPKKTKQE